MKQFLIMGVDVSKSSLDIFVKPLNRCLKIQNNSKGFQQLLEFKKLEACGHKIIVVMEHTGRYSYSLELFLQQQQMDYCKIAALQIKRSLGITRGKTDQVDAERIATYGWLRRDDLVPQQPVNNVIMELRSLISLRSKLVRDRAGYTNRLKEIKSCKNIGSNPIEVKIQEQVISMLTKQIHKVEDQLKLVIQSDDSLQQTCDLLRSLKGVGWIIGIYMIASTDNFKRFTNARKYNCYAGLAPFNHQSGTSLKQRSRVSHLANKDAKTLLNLAAGCAIQHDPELKLYYQKRIAEGKTKMSCLNIVRSKIVSRMFAVVKRQTPYQMRPIAA